MFREIRVTSFRRDKANRIFSVCFQLLGIVLVHAFFNKIPQRKSEDVRSGDLGGHNPCEMILSLKNSFSKSVAALAL
jgi:regulatory protein YycI of two-component signal transduction system YycFG